MDLEQMAQELKDKRNNKEAETYRQLRQANVPPALAAKAKAWGKEKILKELEVVIK